MKCPLCGFAETGVVETRLGPQGEFIRRRRQCERCEGRFTTKEQAELHLPAVVKKDGRREGYAREKILTGIVKACQKRPVAAEAIDSTVQEIEKSILSLNTKEIDSKKLGLMVMDALHKLDKVAYIRFASVYREFCDVEEFVKEIRHGTKTV